MRVHVVLFALATTPFLAASAQEQAGTAQNAGRCVIADASRSSAALPPERRLDPFGRPRTGCAPAAPVTEPGGGTGDGGGGGTPTGTPQISGTVWNGNSWLGMGGWSVQITGAATASTVSNADGSFGFWNLPAGTYLVCQVIPSGWVQTWPTSGATCPTGLGWTVTISGASAAGLDFVDIQ